MDEFLGRRVQLNLEVDNTQAIAAIRKGYSKRLRHLARTHRVSIGVLNELACHPDMMVAVTHVTTDLQKADIMTKALTPAAFAKACKLVGIGSK